MIFEARAVGAYGATTRKRLYQHGTCPTMRTGRSRSPFTKRMVVVLRTAQRSFSRP